MRPSEFVDLMVIANNIPAERKQRLNDSGVSWREIPLSEFIAATHRSEQNIASIRDKPESDILDNHRPVSIKEITNNGGAASVYLLNTDSKSLGGTSPHLIWLQSEHAYTAGDYTKYGERILGKLHPGDIVFAYANTIGVVAIGFVKDRWDGRRYSENQVVYTEPYADVEYKIPVQWACNLERKPIPPQPFIDTCLARPANSAFIRITRLTELVDFVQKHFPDISSILQDSLTNQKGNS